MGNDICASAREKEIKGCVEDKQPNITEFGGCSRPRIHVDKKIPKEHMNLFGGAIIHQRCNTCAMRRARRRRKRKKASISSQIYDNSRIHYVAKELRGNCARTRAEPNVWNSSSHGAKPTTN